jgi:hypothetical protein
MVHGKYEKTNVAGSIDRDSTVYSLCKYSKICYKVNFDNGI